MLAASTTATLPTIESWLLEPTSSSAADLRRHERRETLSQRARVRHLLFDLGAGSIRRLRNLSREDAALVRAAMRDAYSRYRHRSVVENRTPIAYSRYLSRWLRFQKATWLQHDIPLRARERLGMA